MIREQILNGKLTMPNIHDMESVHGEQVYGQIQAMFSAMWYVYLTKGTDATISLPYWAKRINNVRAMNQALKILSDAGWITVSTRPNNNWSEAYLNKSKLLTYVTKTQLDAVRKYHKFDKYLLELHHMDQDFGAMKTKSRGKIFNSGITRKGFAKTGKVPYQFDTQAMFDNKDLVVFEINKGIEKMIEQYPQIAHDHANYREVGVEIVEAYIHGNDAQYNGGPRTSDPRGRNNRGDLSKIGNPVGFKIMRSLLVIPEQHRNIATATGLKNKYLFVAELNGFKAGTVEDKIEYGRECYYYRRLAHDAVEQVWLSRTYDDIDRALNRTGISESEGALKIAISLESSRITKSIYKWQVPIEIDASASVLSYIGLLLGHKPYLDRCNVTMGDLTDAWDVEGIADRNKAKLIMRPLYGSQMSVTDMWNDMDIEYTSEEVEAFNKALESGEFAPAVAMKDFIINNANMQPEMVLHVNNERTLTYCNKFHNVGEKTSVFDLYDTHTNSIRRVHNTETRKVPDLKSFKRYGQTGNIHHLDSMVMNNAVDAVYNQYGWVIDIHDAMVLCPESADYGREIYANGRTTKEPSLAQIYRDRNKILSDYFTSLNIPASKVSEWKTDVMSLVEPLTEPLVVNPLCLK